MTTVEERLAETEKEDSEHKDVIPYAKFVDGINKLQIDTSKPLEKSKFGRMTYTANLNGENVKISLPVSVERKIREGLRKSKKTFTITKSGTGMDTRYKVS